MALNVGSVDQQLTATPATVLTGAVGSQFTIMKATACNNDTVARTITVYRVAAGGTSSTAGSTIIPGFSIGAGETVVLPLSGQPLVNGSFLQAKASTTSVINLNIGYSYTP
jgi:hypothetical protein